MPSDAATLEELLQPLRDAPERSAVLLDVDGVLAPIVQQPDDAHMPETTRRPLIEVARRYGVVACVSGRRASDARRIVSLGSIAYLGSHGSEVLRPGAIAPELDRELQAWARRVQEFTNEAFGEKLRRLRVRLEDKEAIAALHWRGTPDEDEAIAAIEDVAEAAEQAGFVTHWGRKVLEIRPPVRIDKGAGIVGLLHDTDLAAAVYVGDDVTDLDAFRGLGELQERGRLGYALRVGVRSDETPSALEEEADKMVEGPDGVRGLLRALLDLSVRFGDFLKATVLLSAASATLLAALTVIALSREIDETAAYVSAAWWALATLIGIAVGARPQSTAAIARLLATARMQHSLPELSPARTIANRLWPLLVATLGAGVLSFFAPQVAGIAAGFAIIWALAWRRQEAAVAAIEERDGVRFYVDKTSPLQSIRLIRTPGFGGDFLSHSAG